MELQAAVGLGMSLHVVDAVWIAETAEVWACWCVGAVESRSRDDMVETAPPPPPTQGLVVSTLSAETVQVVQIVVSSKDGVCVSTLEIATASLGETARKVSQE